MHPCGVREETPFKVDPHEPEPSVPVPDVVEFFNMDFAISTDPVLDVKLLHESADGPHYVISVGQAVNSPHRLREQPEQLVWRRLAKTMFPVHVPPPRGGVPA